MLFDGSQYGTLTRLGPQGYLSRSNQAGFALTPPNGELDQMKLLEQGWSGLSSLPPRPTSEVYEKRQKKGAGGTLRKIRGEPFLKLH